MSAPEIITPRLRLRRWRDGDIAPFIEQETDLRVLRYLPWKSRPTPERVRHFVACIRFEMAINPYGFWAVETPGVADFIGAVGLGIQAFDCPDFTPCMALLWRLSHDFWGKGYATEAARAVLAYAFETLHLDEIVSMANVENKRSLAVMERIGLRHERNFQWPPLPEGHPLRPHALYKLRREDWIVRAPVLTS